MFSSDFPKSNLKKLKYILIRNKNTILLQNNDFVSFKIFSEIKNLIEKNSKTNFFYEKELLICALEIPDDFEINSLKVKNILNENKIFQDLIEISIRQYFSFGNSENSILVARAKSILDWNKKMQFCPTCAKKLVWHKNFSAKNCDKCNSFIFPRIEPCIIVLVKKQDEILLVRHTYRNQNMFTCIAGFIEVGENAENAVLREVKEEVGLNVKNIKYKGSQSWPFPDQLMLAFTAEYESGTIKLQKDEISQAKWFNKNNLPFEDDVIPKAGSVAHKLINNLF